MLKTPGSWNTYTYNYTCSILSYTHLKGSKTTFQIGKAPLIHEVELLEPPRDTVIFVFDDLPPSRSMKPDADMTATLSFPFG